MNMNGTITVERMSAVSVNIIKGWQYVFVGGAFIQGIREIWIWKTGITEEDFTAYMMGVVLVLDHLLKKLVKAEIEILYLLVDQLENEELRYISYELENIKRELKARIRNK